MKRILTALLILAIVPQFCFSRNISEDSKSDSLVLIPISEIRIANEVFLRHDYLKSQNDLLLEQISLLERSQRAKNSIISSQDQQIDALQKIIVKKDEVISIKEDINQQYKESIELQRKQKWKYAAVGGVTGIAITSLLFVIFK